MSDTDELDINPFFRALQREFSTSYDRAQSECFVICVPKSECLKGTVITEKFIDTHILKPSPFFKGHYYTLRSEKQVVTLDDAGEYVFTTEGFPTRTKIKIMYEELGYNKDYKPYKILILDRPLDINVLKHRIENGTTVRDEVQLEYTFTGCKRFLYKYPDFAKPLRELETELEKFNSRYLLLKDYLHEAADRLQHLVETTAQKCSQFTKDRELKSSKGSLYDLLNTAVESFVTGSVYKKLYGVICEKCQQEDGCLQTKYRSLHGLASEHLSVPKPFCVPIPAAVTEIRKLDRMTTPLEKLYCLKNTIDKITEEISAHIQKYHDPNKQGAGPPCLTSDDLIPILVTVLVEASCPHLHAAVYYIDNFYWFTTTRDKDTLSYCLVTFKAAVQYLLQSDFSDLDLSSTTHKPTAPPNTRALDANRKPRSPAFSTSANGSTVSPPSINPLTNHRARVSTPQDMKAKLDQQLESIDKMLEDSTSSLGQSKIGQSGLGQTARRPSPKPVSSIFGGTISYSPTPESSKPEKTTEDMGDFLSSLQNDMFSFGKQN